jgi:molecular chaperone GrpE
MSSKQQESRHEAHKKADSESPETVASGTGQSADQVPRSGEAPIPGDSAPEAAPRNEGADAEEKSASRVAELEKELAALREELSSVNDKYLRKLADDVNFRKRMAREKEDGQRFAVAALLGDLIPVLDDFDRAIASAETQRDYGVLHDGIGLIRRQLGSVLESKYGLVRFESKGKPFDPNVHEAVAMVQGNPEDGDEAVVAEEFLPGYGLHERVLRTAKVRVRMPAPGGAAASAPPDAAAAEPAADKQEN